MSFLLDTNVVSEWHKPQPDPGAAAWLVDNDEDRMFLSVVTLAELRYGASRLPRSRRRELLDHWIDFDLRNRFAERIIPLDEEIGLVCGEILAERDAIGRPMEIMDAFIAATARTIGLSLVTRNEGDFAGTVSDIINPWAG
ncbi:MAG TPA: type II toxin-antitoxin system VapC family toxin [Stellaceae bacterium]|nr:type II toxin-antitoxin system VapC family toxin [Stellaceae bacterium]